MIHWQPGFSGYPFFKHQRQLPRLMIHSTLPTTSEFKMSLEFQAPEEKAGIGREIATSGPWQVRWIDSVSELESLSPAWQELAEKAICRNVAMEPRFLVPAWKHLADVKVRVLVVQSGEQLLALLPLVKKTLFRLPVAAMEVWRHEQCFDATPLLRREVAGQVWQQIVDFLHGEGLGLLSLDLVNAEPRFDSILSACCRESGLPLFSKQRFERAAIRPYTGAAEYLEKHASKNLRKTTRRQLRRLENLGNLTVSYSTPDSDFSAWAREFLELEKSGWKGLHQTALGSRESTTRFYEELISRSVPENGARFLALRMNGRPIAMLSDLAAGDQAWCYKTAYDESFADFSPGLLAEIRNIDYMHQDGIRFADSCTAADNSTLNRLWGERVKFQHAVVALRPGLPTWVIRSLPLAQRLVRRFRPGARRCSHPK